MKTSRKLNNHGYFTTRTREHNKTEDWFCWDYLFPLLFIRALYGLNLNEVYYVMQLWNSNSTLKCSVIITTGSIRGVTVCDTAHMLVERALMRKTHGHPNEQVTFNS
jgi:hypothetical protein